MMITTRSRKVANVHDVDDEKPKKKMNVCAYMRVEITKFPILTQHTPSARQQEVVEGEK